MFHVEVQAVSSVYKVHTKQVLENANFVVIAAHRAQVKNVSPVLKDTTKTVMVTVSLVRQGL